MKLKFIIALSASAWIASPLQAAWRFTEVGVDAGASHAHGFLKAENPNLENHAGGVAAADYDRDGDIDLYLVTGDITTNRLLRNNGDGSFSDVAEDSGVGLEGHRSTGPAFADIDADGWPDLVVGGIDGAGYRVFKNLGDGNFIEFTDEAGIFQQEETQSEYTTAFGDPDGDGDLDAFISHWGSRNNRVNHYWVNAGGGRFYPADARVGYATPFYDDNTFTPNFVDMDGDGRQDLLLTGDFGSSQVLKNVDGKRFIDTTTIAIDDENGMGAAVADFDNDGDFDWFVTSIHHEESPQATIGYTGNRLYLNDGAGNFGDVGAAIGVDRGHWGWGACAADLNNDGWLDIFHVNGMPLRLDDTDFDIDPTRLFISNGDFTFAERSQELGIVERDQGRGVVCFDYDNDGDIDLLTQNWTGWSHLYRNDLDPGNGWLQVDLTGSGDNPDAIGAIVRVTTGDSTQTRQVAAGSNYASQNPLLQHFGLGTAERIDTVRVEWPHGGVTDLKDVDINQRLTISAAESVPEPFRIRFGHSAAWYDPEHNGEGFLMEILDDGRAIVYWFTYDSEGGQDWYIAVGEVQGNRAVFPQLLRVSGGVFGPDFDPAKIEYENVGSAALTWSECDKGHMDWYIGDGHDRQELERITRLFGLDCGLPLETQPPLAGLSGSWYDPSHNGEGYIVEVFSETQFMVYWFSYGPEGERRWFFGVGEVREGKLVVDEMLTTHGGIFGPDFNPENVEVDPWGKLELVIDCGGGTASWESTEEGVPAGQLELVRLSNLAGLHCQ